MPPSEGGGPALRVGMLSQGLPPSQLFRVQGLCALQTTDIFGGGVKVSLSFPGSRPEKRPPKWSGKQENSGVCGAVSSQIMCQKPRIRYF
jgi:hypothetical protein